MPHNNEIINKEQIIKQKLIQKISDALDVNYNVSQVKIESMDEFYNQLYIPFKNGSPVYYRGEKRSSPTRKLLPTFLRTDEIISNYRNMPIVNLDYNKLFDFYNQKSQFMSVYKTIYPNESEQNIYNMLAFAQHYLGISPFIDFSKSLYVALSFALKGRDEIDEDIVIYTALDIDCDDTSNDIDEVNSWLESYNVSLINIEHIDFQKGLINPINYKENISELIEQGKQIKELKDNINKAVPVMSPKAKLIDIPTNDLMKYQQGVFLLLNDFSIIDSNYLTKTVRQTFVLNKYIISYEICKDLKEFLADKAPQYKYEFLLNISKAVK